MTARRWRQRVAAKRILFLTHRVPFPPDKGDKIRTFHALEHLAASHEIWCACFVDRSEDFIHAAALREWCRQVIAVPWRRSQAAVRAARGWCLGRPMTLGAYHDPRMWEAVRRLSRAVRFDVASAFSACMAPYALAVDARRRVLDLCDADSEKWRDYAESPSRTCRMSMGHTRHRLWTIDACLKTPKRLVYAAEARRLRRFELRCIESFDATMVVTERERRILDPSQRARRLHVIPNGVRLPAGPPRPPSACPPVVTFVGAMDYPPNVDGILWFADQVWPSLRRIVADARLMIVGASPVRPVRALARRPGISVTARVPDVAPYWARCRAAIAPLFIARGVQNKVLEAMAACRPVVATSAVAACLGAEPGRHFLTADGAESFVRQLAAILTDDRLCDSVGRSGCRFAAAYHNWPQSLRQYESIVVGTKEPVRPSVVGRAPVAPLRRIRAPLTPVLSSDNGRNKLRYHFSRA